MIFKRVVLVVSLFSVGLMPSAAGAEETPGSIMIVPPGSSGATATMQFPQINAKYLVLAWTQPDGIPRIKVAQFNYKLLTGSPITKFYYAEGDNVSVSVDPVGYAHIDAYVPGVGPILLNFACGCLLNGTTHTYGSGEIGMIEEDFVSPTGQMSIDPGVAGSINGQFFQAARYIGFGINFGGAIYVSPVRP
ncbi:MAG: hypothetical protein ABIS18_07385 [Actinomycetota bacterium]